MTHILNTSAVVDAVMFNVPTDSRLPRTMQDIAVQIAVRGTGVCAHNMGVCVHMGVCVWDGDMCQCVCFLHCGVRVRMCGLVWAEYVFSPVSVCVCTSGHGWLHMSHGPANEAHPGHGCVRTMVAMATHINMAPTTRAPSAHIDRHHK